MFSHPMLLGIGHFLYGFVDVLAVGYEVSGIWFIVSFILFVTRHMGEGTPAAWQRL